MEEGPEIIATNASLSLAILSEPEKLIGLQTGFESPFMFLNLNDNSVLNYGFQKKLGLSPSLQLNVRDLWAWIKTILHPNNPRREKHSNDLIVNMKESVIRIVREPTDIVCGYEVCSSQSDAFLQLFSPKYDNMLEKDFLRYVVYKLLIFDYSEARKAISDRLSAEAKKNSEKLPISELQYIHNFLKAFDIKNMDNQAAVSIWRKSVDFETFEDPYMKFIQFILSERFLQAPENIMSFSGVYFMDRLYLLVKFFPKQTERLLGEYLAGNRSLEIIPIIANDPERVRDILQNFLDETGEILITGLAAKLLAMIKPEFQVSHFEKALDQFLLNNNLSNVAQLIKRELSTFSSRVVMPPWKPEEDAHPGACHSCSSSQEAEDGKIKR